MVKNRYITHALKKLCFAPHKMAFVSGPRQSGKTTLARSLLKHRGAGAYFNWDEKGFRLAWAKHPLAVVKAVFGSASDEAPLTILDEIHKAKGWKRDLKGVYDSLSSPMDIIVTGSARLNVYRRGSDSLLGRYHHFRLHPFSLAELLENQYSVWDGGLLKVLQQGVQNHAAFEQHLGALWHFGPFPQPLFMADPNELNLWQLERIQRLVREDLRDLSRIQDLSQIEMLIAMLPERAAGVLSINALREDLEVAYATMKTWLQYLKAIYYVYEIKPYAHKIPRSLKKEGKLYLYDWSEVVNEGARFENMIASHLLKYVHFLTDTGVCKADLCYLRNRQGAELDFLLVKDQKPWLPIEVKLHDVTPSKNWSYYFKHLPCKMGLQIVQTPDIEKRVAVGEGEVLVISASRFLPLLV